MSNHDIKRVGIVGLGKMGRPIARQIRAQGYGVAGFDVNGAAAQRAAGDGTPIARSLAGLCAGSDLLLILVGFDAEVEEVIYGSAGAMSSLPPGAVVVVSSTVAPQTMKRLAHRLQRQDIALVDAPLTRGEEAAEQGRLLVLAGGDAQVLERCRPVFAAFADPVHHLGPLGAGQVGKMVNNLILWACMSANFEGLKLAEALGLDPERLRRALVDSSANNWSLQTRAEEKPVPWAEKDMALVLQEAALARLSLPLCGTVKEVITRFKLERGLPTPPSPES